MTTRHVPQVLVLWCKKMTTLYVWNEMERKERNYSDSAIYTCKHNYMRPHQSVT